MKKILLMLLLCSTARADFQTWLALNTGFPVTEKVLGFAEIQNRLSNNSSTQQRLLVRAAMGVRLTDTITLWAGYGWTPVFTPVYQPEHRLWQQVMTKHVWDHWTLTARFRLEERFIDATTSMQWRWREMIRGSYHPESTKHWGIVLWDEFLYGINGNEASLAGYHQNRFFMGVALPIREDMVLEPGYMMVTQRDPTTDTLHVLSVSLYWDTDNKPPQESR